MKFLSLLLAAAAATTTVLSAPLQDFDVTVLSTGPSDTSCHPVSLYPPGVSTSGISTVLDSDRGYAWERLSTADTNAGLRVTNSTLGKSYSKAAWIKLSAIGYYPQIMDSLPPATGTDETGAHFFQLTPSGALYAGHNVGSTQSSRWWCLDSGVAPLNEWHHVAVTYDVSTGSFALYRNGTLTAGPTCGQGNTISRDNWNGSPYDTIIGNYAGYGIQARMQDMQQYNIALTSQHIAQIFAQPVP